MAGHDLIVVGASAGGLEALRAVVAGLPADLPAAVCVVWHMSTENSGVLPGILQRAGALPASHPQDGEPLQTGRIYVAIPDRHLVIEDGRLRLSQGPKENRFRPAVDPLFRSAAAAYGSRVIGVVLTGSLDDGAAGMEAIKARGGLAVVQDPDDALFPSMPRSVLKHVAVDHVAAAAAIGPLLAELVGRPAQAMEAPLARELEIETRIALEDNALASGVMELGELSPYTCPECHGTLLQMKSNGILRFRCHTGHAYSIDSLLMEVAGSIEVTLWGAMRAIEEQMLLLRHVAEHRHQKNDPAASDQLLLLAREAEQQVQLVRLAVLRHEQRMKASPETSRRDDV